MRDSLNRMATVAAYAMSQCASNGCGPDYWYDLSKNYGSKSSYYGSTCKKSRDRQKVGHKNKKLCENRKHNKTAKKARKKQRGK